jgi:hypothetical protein
MISYSDTAPTISETLQTNATVWMHSLPEHEMGPSRRILEDLEGLATAGGFPVFAYAVQDRAELNKSKQLPVVCSILYFRPRRAYACSASRCRL